MPPSRTSFPSCQAKDAFSLRCGQAQPHIEDVNISVYRVENHGEAAAWLAPVRDKLVATGWQVNPYQIGDEGFLSKYKDGERFEIDCRRGSVVARIAGNDLRRVKDFARCVIDQIPPIRTAQIRARSNLRSSPSDTQLSSIKCRSGETHFSGNATNQACGIGLVNTSAFVGTQSDRRTVTSGLPREPDLGASLIPSCNGRFRWLWQSTRIVCPRYQNPC